MTRISLRPSCVALLIFAAGCIPSRLDANWHRLSEARARLENCQLMFRHATSACAAKEAAYRAEEESYQAALAARR